MRKALLITSLLTLATAFAGAAQAQSGGWMGGRMDTNIYVGGHIGQSAYRKSCDNIPVDCDDKDTGWKLLAGYQFHKNIAVEAGYFDLGKASASGLVGGLPVSADARVRGFELVGVGILPITNVLSVYGKAGLARSRSTSSAFAAGVAASAKETTTDFTFGVGGQYLITPHLAARLEWQRYDGVGGDVTGKDDIDLFSAGLLYRF